MTVKITVRQAATATATVNIPEDVKRDVEAAYKELTKNPGSELHLAFDDEAERIAWTGQARAYCQTRQAGALKLRQLPSKNLPVNEARFNITADLPVNGSRGSDRKPA